MHSGESTATDRPAHAETAVQTAWRALAPLTDPEIPVVTLQEMGILREVRPATGAAPDTLEVIITPTYSGCPAMDQIREDIQAALTKAGLQGVVTTQLAPAWTTDWIGAQARDKLRAYGIAPPGPVAGCTGGGPTGTHVLRFVREMAPTTQVPCPRCGSTHTVEKASFGSTACKALYQCLDCREPFDHFKPI